MSSVALVRKNLIPLLDKVDATAHAGLLVQRGLRVWQGKETKDQKDKDDKKDLIDLISRVKSSELYQLAFDRWLLQTYQGEGASNTNSKFSSLSASIDGRLMTGLSVGGTLETGVTTHHTYGMPLLAGSAIKGAVRAYAENIFSQKDAEGKIVLVKDRKGVERSIIDPAMQPILNILFGADEEANQPNAGYLIWHDAWWIPTLTKNGEYSSNDDAKPFVGEIVTVHHQKYYSDKTGRIEALDMEPPIPTQQLAVQGQFYFVIEGEAQWVQFAKQLFETMLQNFGLGAKGASGYGYFKLDSDLEQNLKMRYNSLIAFASVDSNDPYAEMKRELLGLNDSKLIETLSKKLSKFMKDYGLEKSNTEHCKIIVDTVKEKRKDWIQEWENAISSNAKDAFKFIDKYKA